MTGQRALVPMFARSEPLPRGLGAKYLTREEVVASQRGRILDALVEAVAARGYAATTIGDVTARARVSRRTFYEQFSGIEECTLEAYAVGIEVLRGEMELALAESAEQDWRVQVRSLYRAILTVLAPSRHLPG